MNRPQLVETPRYVDDVGRRCIVVTVPTYEEAAAAVAYLDDAQFPVERVTIAARDLTLVENVVGTRRGRTCRRQRPRHRHPDRALRRAPLRRRRHDRGRNGARSRRRSDDLGAVAGVLLALLFHALAARRNRGVVSVSGVHADRYDVLVDEELFDETVELLNEWALADTSRRLRME